MNIVSQHRRNLHKIPELEFNENKTPHIYYRIFY